MTVSKSKNGSITPRNTLAALYKANGKEVIVVPPTLANGSKYIYQIDQRASDAEDEDKATASPSASQIKLQALVPQQMAFSVGKMGMIIFDNSSMSPASSEHEKSLSSQTERVLQSLSPEQRPELIFQNAPNLLEAKFLKHPLAVCTPIDALELYNVAIPLETSYTLLTKETLARSSIPGPKSKILAVDLPASASDEIHNEWLRSTISALCSQISTHPVPFVLKFTQTISGHGVHIIHTLSERTELCNVTLPPLLHHHLQCLNSANAHLRPCNLVLTDLILEDEVVANYSLTFFVHCEGSWTSHCCGKQHVKDHKGSKTQYAGTSVDYAVQSELREKLHSTIQSITDFLHGEGYYGPVGADVLETRDGTQYVIDLNVRWTSSWILGTLRKHFYGTGTGLGLRRARLVMMHFEVGMKEFEEIMDEELSEGRVVVVARFEMGGKSWVHLVVGGGEWGDVERVVGKMEGLCGGEAEEDGD